MATLVSSCKTASEPAENCTNNCLAFIGTIKDNKNKLLTDAYVVLSKEGTDSVVKEISTIQTGTSGNFYF